MPLAETSFDVKSRRRNQYFDGRQPSEGSITVPELNTDPRMLQGATIMREGSDVVISRTNPLSSFGVDVGMGNNYDDSHGGLGALHNEFTTEQMDAEDMFQTPTKDDEERARHRRVTATPIHVNVVDSSELTELIAAVCTCACYTCCTPANVNLMHAFRPLGTLQCMHLLLAERSFCLNLVRKIIGASTLTSTR